MGTTVVNDPASNAASGFSWLPPFLASLFYLCINAMTWKELDERFVQQPSTAKKARVFLLCILFVAMCSVVGAAYSAFVQGAQAGPFPPRRAPLALQVNPRHSHTPPPRARSHGGQVPARGVELQVGRHLHARVHAPHCAVCLYPALCHASALCIKLCVRALVLYPYQPLHLSFH